MYTLFVVLAGVIVLTWPGIVVGAAKDDPLLAKLMLNEFEYRAAAGDGDGMGWDVQAWVGHDINKLWMTAEGNTVDGSAEEAELQALYSRAISAFWDAQIGWRGDFRPEPDRQWATLGLRGIAPYLFDVDVAVFLSDGGHTAARVDAHYEWLFTQRLILGPNIEVNFNGKDDPDRGIGSGLSDLELGLRLRYEIRREFAPYIGVRWEGQFGDTADFAEQAGDDTSDWEILLGIRAWL